MRHPLRRPLYSVVTSAIAAVALAACGAQPQPARPAYDAPGRMPMQGPGLTAGPTATLPGAVPATTAEDTKIKELLTKVNQTREAGRTADINLNIKFYKDDGTTAFLRSRYAFEKPKRNAIEITASNDPKVVGTKLVWTGGDKVQIKTKFIGFWIKTSLDLMDERLKDQRGYRIDETAVDRCFATLLHPQAQVRIASEGTMQGKPMTMLEVISPLRLKPTTKEMYGIDMTNFTPAVREMYVGTKLIYRMQVESETINAKLTAKDFSLD